MSHEPSQLAHPKEYDSRYLEYIELFNVREFYDCHEVLEDLWLDDWGDRKKFYQGLIQFATAFYHLYRRNMSGCEKLLASSKAYLSRYPDFFEGLDLAEIRKVIHYWQHKLAARRGDEIVAYDDSKIPMLKLENRDSEP